MDEWILSGRAVDWVLLLVAVEAVVLLAYPPTRARAAQWLATLAAGTCLLLALRAALTDAHWVWIAIALTGAGLAHSADLIARRPARTH